MPVYSERALEMLVTIHEAINDNVHSFGRLRLELWSSLPWWLDQPAQIHISHNVPVLNVSHNDYEPVDVQALHNFFLVGYKWLQTLFRNQWF